MKICKNYSLAFLTSGLLLLILFFGCAEYQNQTSNPNTNITDNTENIISYCAKEKSKENRVFFNYPQFKETTPNANELNGLILGFVKDALQRLERGFGGNLKDYPEDWGWNWAEPEYTHNAMNISYNITRNDSNYLSVTFEGWFHHIKAAYPSHLFYSLTIDKVNVKIIFIDDLYCIDDDFIEFFQSNINELVREGLARKFQILPDDISDDVVKIILEASNNNNFSEIKGKLTSNGEYSYPFFLTDEAVGISISIPHVMGDHFEILISYDELSKYLIDSNLLKEVIAPIRR